MQFSKLLVAVAFAAVSAVAAAVPSVLIVPTRAKQDLPPMDSIANFIAQELDDVGKVEPIVWGMTDPLFRVAVLEGRVRTAPDEPTLDQAIRAAGELKADYLLTYSAKVEKGLIHAKIEIRRGSRVVWSHDDNVAVTSEGQYDAEDSGKSLARTWALMLNGGPFKDLPPKPKAVTPDVLPGQSPPELDPLPADPPKVDDGAELRKRIGVLLQAKQVGEAILVAKDAVDMNPLSPERRRILVETLLAAGDQVGAAKEARRAASLLGDQPDLWVVSARAWISSGNLSEARADLNEAVARDPEAIDTRMLLADVALMDLRPEQAIGHLDQVIKLKPTGDAFYKRALTRCLLGGFDGAKLDLEELAKLEPETSPVDALKRYELAMDLLDKGFAQQAEELKTLMQAALVRRNDPKVAEAQENLFRLAHARSLYAGHLQSPPVHEKSHDRRLLALNLLSQSIAGVESYIKDGKEDDMTDARINLGEALKHFAAAKEAFATERDSGDDGDTRP